SQAAIMALPSLRPRGTTAILSPTYGEYAAAWQAAGHAVRFFVPDELENVAAACDAVMVANPNNPTGARFTRCRLLDAARTLHDRGGKLIVDEAFADAEDGESLAAIAGSHEAPNLVVLRSLGKFFGLAGARVGFAIGRSAVLERLAEAVGPWAVAHPAREAARAALADVAWQREQRERLHAASARLERLLMVAGLGASSGTALFRYLAAPRAAEIAESLARQGVLVRRFDDPPALRFGLPGAEAEWHRLAAALAQFDI
ncbi:MAG TPA: aminotransferase class I/II-fold pyridoxal phosphate-dependent enzyme, partial [Rhodocyclaceae bacterium]